MKKIRLSEEAYDRLQHKLNEDEITGYDIATSFEDFYAMIKMAEPSPFIEELKRVIDFDGAETVVENYLNSIR